MSEEVRTCETRDHCTYIGEGDFICARDEPVLVIIDWQAVREACRRWVER